MNAKFLKPKIDWFLVAKEVSRITGKAYECHYIRDCARGRRLNKQLTPILRDLGVYTAEVA